MTTSPHRRNRPGNTTATDAQAPTTTYPDAAEQHRRSRLRPRPDEGQPAPPRQPPLSVPGRSGIGICCSGGGIRSAAYNLGVLQELSAQGVLQRADYLSAVSGGSYIAAAMAIATRHSDRRLLEDTPAFSPGTPEEIYLRNRCSYLAATLSGKARLTANVLVGLVVNLVLVGLVVYVSARPLGWLYATWYEELVVSPACREVGGPGCFAPVALTVPAALTTSVLTAGGIGVALLVLDRMVRWRRPAQHRLVAGAGAGMLGAATVVGVVAIVVPELVALVRNVVTATAAVPGEQVAEQVLGGTAAKSSKDRGATVLTLFSGGGVAAIVAAVLVQVRSAARDVAGLSRTAVRGLRMLGPRLRNTLLYLVGGVVGPLAMATVFLIVVNNAAAGGPLGAAAGGGESPGAWEVGGWVIALAALAFVYLYADLTRWSMHPFYKRRLASAFTLKRTTDRRGEPVVRPLDYAKPLALSDFARERYQTPFPEVLVCAAANVADQGATPPGSGVTSFVLSPTEVGGPLVGGMPTDEYEAAVGGTRQRDVTLLASVAISGAAVAPSMGKMTKPPLRFLMALANLRLGVWLPNPRRVRGWRGLNRRVAFPANPRPHYLLYELVGWNRLNSRFLYVSDGGHYENLGLVELLRRRCTEIYCFDAAGGQVHSYTTLGEALSLARTELGVEVELDPTPMRGGDGTGLCASDHVLGTVRYPDGQQGRMVFAKAGVIRNLPWDVRAYAEKDPEFPTHSTADQFYTGERFEAYRKLGSCAAHNAVASMRLGARQHQERPDHQPEPV